MDLIKGLGSIVLPGDTIGKIPEIRIRLGPGLTQDQDHIVATKQGILRSPMSNYYWVENTQKRYIPAIEDMVIGVITEKYADSYKVDLGSAHSASLSSLAFENATKRSRPNLNVGTTVYARVSVAHKDMDPEIVCYSARNKADGYGELIDGHSFKCSLGLAYALLDEDCEVLNLVGKKIPFEIAVGMNGRVWVKSENHKNTILITNVIQSSEFLSIKEIEKFIEKALSK